MTKLQEKFEETMTEIYISCLELMRRKNADYTGGEDPFSNFRDAAYMSSLPGHEAVTLEQTILSRIADKYSRIRSLLAVPGNEGAVRDESIEDTLRDAIVYPAILLTWLKLGKPNPESFDVFDEPIFEENVNDDSGLATSEPGNVLTKFFKWSK